MDAVVVYTDEIERQLVRLEEPGADVDTCARPSIAHARSPRYFDELRAARRRFR
jgi:hypothetical protein